MNPLINTIDSMVGALNLVNELSAKSDDIYKFLSSDNSSESKIKSKFASAQIKEERQKASKIIDDPEFESKIVESENLSFFKGRIRDLIDVDDKGNYKWETYKKDRYKKFDKWIRKDKILTVRALLSYTKGKAPYPFLELTKDGDEGDLIFSNLDKILNGNESKDIFRQFIDLNKDKVTLQKMINDFDDDKSQYYLIIKEKNIFDVRNTFNNKLIFDGKVIKKDGILYVNNKGKSGAKTYSNPETIILFDKLKREIKNYEKYQLNYYNGDSRGDTSIFEDSRRGRIGFIVESISSQWNSVDYDGKDYRIQLFYKDSNEKEKIENFVNSLSVKGFDDVDEKNKKFICKGTKNEVVSIIKELMKQ